MGTTNHSTSDRTGSDFPGNIQAGHPEPFSLTPPPWQLTGEGYLFLYRLPGDHPATTHHWPEPLRQGFAGGWGYLMLVNYHQSPVGPYKEILFIPGKTQTSRGIRHSISTIYVDSPASVSGGRTNWGIPKHLAHIDWRRQGRTTRIQVIQQDQPCFAATIRHHWLPFPISTALLPLKLYQEWEGTAFETQPEGHGWGHWATLESARFHPPRVPDWGPFRPWMGTYVNPFHLTFPPPTYQQHLK